MKPYRRLQNRQVIMPRRNKHHLMWAGWMYRTNLEREFRRLGCVQIKIDTLVHGYLHAPFGNPRKARARTMIYIIGRHRGRRCGCFDPSQRVRVNLLDIERKEYLPEEIANLECLVKYLDVEVVNLMRASYRKPKRLRQSDVRRLVARHHIQSCGCFNTQVSQDQVYRRLRIAA